MRFLFSIIAFLALTLSSSAETPRPNTPMDTLVILKNILASDPRVTSATIDAANLLLAVKAADSTEYTISPDNLFRQLQSAASAKDRADLVAT